MYKSLEKTWFKAKAHHELVVIRRVEKKEKKNVWRNKGHNKSSAKEVFIFENKTNKQKTVKAQ